MLWRQGFHKAIATIIFTKQAFRIKLLTRKTIYSERTVEIPSFLKTFFKSLFSCFSTEASKHLSRNYFIGKNNASTYLFCPSFSQDYITNPAGVMVLYKNRLRCVVSLGRIHPQQVQVKLLISHGAGRAASRTGENLSWGRWEWALRRQAVGRPPTSGMCWQTAIAEAEHPPKPLLRSLDPEKVTLTVGVTFAYLTLMLPAYLPGHKLYVRGFLSIWQLIVV